MFYVLFCGNILCTKYKQQEGGIGGLKRNFYSIVVHKNKQQQQQQQKMKKRAFCAQAKHDEHTVLEVRLNATHFSCRQMLKCNKNCGWYGLTWFGYFQIIFSVRHHQFCSVALIITGSVILINICQTIWWFFFFFCYLDCSQSIQRTLITEMGSFPDFVWFIFIIFDWDGKNEEI